MVKKTGSSNNDCQPFKSVNAFVRQMTLSVSDYGELWPFFDATHFPNPITVHLGREIYSDPVGTCTDSGNIVLPLGPAKPPNEIKVWAWDRIDAVQLTYPSGQGPGAATTTPRMGDQDGGSDQGPAPHGGVFDVQHNPVVVANGAAGTILNSFNFTFKDGTTSGKLGGSANTGGTGQGFSFSYDGHILSSIHINGVSNYYGSADCAVFGFKYAEPVTDASIFEIPFGWTTTS